MARFYAHPYNWLIRTLLTKFVLIFLIGISAQAQGVPVINSFSPTTGPVGTEVTINGSGFTEAHTVSIGNGATYEFTIVSDSEIRIKVPSLASNGAIRVSSNQGAASSSTGYTVVNAPAITSFSPSSGPVGTEVTIIGTNFSTVTAISIGSGSTTSFTKVSDTEIKVTVPSLASNGAIRVSSNQGAASSSTGYTVVNAPAITSFSPSSGPVGTEVTIIGT
ncbi:IPT/TIG domain-containing protein, partial [Pontibacter sp. KCTC 32443]